MLKYKALYKKMMDDLKDSGMWIEWASKLEKDDPEVSKFLYASAKERLTSNFEQTKQLFDKLCTSDTKNEKYCLKELVEEDLCEWHEQLMQKLKMKS